MKKVFIISVLVAMFAVTALTGCDEVASDSNIDSSNVTTNVTTNAITNTTETETTIALTEPTSTVNSYNDTIVNYDNNLDEAEEFAGFEFFTGVEFSDELPELKNIQAIENTMISVECARADYNDEISNDSVVYIRKALTSAIDEDENFYNVDEDSLCVVSVYTPDTPIGGAFLCDDNGNIIEAKFSYEEYSYNIYCPDTEQGLNRDEADYLINAMIICPEWDGEYRF